MMQLSLRQWCAISVLSGTLMLGCNQAQRQPMPASAMYPTYQVTRLPGPPPSPPVQPSTVPQPVTEMPAPPPSPPAPTPVSEAPKETLPENPAPKEMVTVSYNPPAEVVPKDEPAPRRSFADITAKPCYAHAPDYSWLTGELQQIHPSMEWHLRYASVDEEDPYGGSVTLTETGPMTQYESGQCVRVQGRLVNPDAHERSPAYRVDSILRIASNP